ncbi:MAG: HEAT repeat domain-containing protein, partial [Candidatus Aminicenantes bacterium]
SNSWPDGVHHWFPCYDYPNDKVTNEIIATVKKGNKVCANGRLLNITENNAEGTVTYHWSQELPHSTYLIFLAAAPYVVIRDSYGTLPINYWVYPQHEQDALRSYENTPKMMEFFNRIYGYEYPWVKYDQVSCPLGGGAESTSATAMTHRIIHDERAEQDFSSIGIVSHELAHQWWGDLITMRTWAHAWMNEGFGTYSDYLYFRYERGEEEGAINLEGKKNGYLRETKTRYLRPIVIDHYNWPGDIFDAHSYRKGACVLHMLRFMVGDKPFFRILKHFLHTHAFDVVDTHDFMNSVKAVTGQNLDWFFEQWIFKPGHPVFDISHSWDENTHTIKLSVDQIQDTNQRIPVFKTPVIIGIWTKKGKESHKIWIKSDHEEFEFRSEQKPLMVRFDEGNYLLKEWSFLKDKEELIYQMQHDDVMGRKWAAGQLLRFEDDREVVRLLKECAQMDVFWAVRRSAVETLGTLEDRELIGFLEQTCTDENSKVRAAALNALGNFESADLIEFFKQRFALDDSYVAQATALEAIGKTGDRNQAVFLKQAAELPSYRNVIRTAAQKALKQLEENRP